jgi:hypothetical protein
MSLFRKVRVLVGALVHRPFMPTPERIDPDEGRIQGLQEAPQAGSPSEIGAVDLSDQDRVADLIARQKRDAG